MPEIGTGNELEQIKKDIDQLEKDIDDLAMEMKFKERLFETKVLRVVQQAEIKGTGANAVLLVGGNAEIKGVLHIESPDKLVQLEEELSARVADTLAADAQFREAVRGPKGAKGIKGLQGLPGLQGRPGKQGPRGKQGFNGMRICPGL
jgi:hypothetical protein